MKIVILFLFIYIQASSLTLVLNSAKEQGNPYATLHLIDNVPILCETKNEAYGKKLYLCMFEGVLKNKIKNKKSPYVNIDFMSKEGNFYIYIKPKFYSQLLNVDAKLYADKTTPLKTKANAKHWTILIYENLPFDQGTKKQNGINFPITYPKLQYPSVGALDLNGAPIEYVQSNDINLYLDIKKLYEKKEYKKVIKQAEKAIENYPDSIFLSEFVLYKIRSIDKILDAVDIKHDYDRNDVIGLAKGWTKSFAANENMPEALMLIAKSYLEMGFYSDANYFLDILISEHPKSNFTQWAILLYADSLYKSGKKKEAVKLFEDVLYASKDVDTASEAAMRLAKYSLNSGKTKKAKEYLSKVLSANKEFVFKDKKAAYALAKNLADKELYKNAAIIAETLLKKTKKIEDDYESLLKDAGLWHERAKDINDAYKYLKQYQKEFKNGEYEAIVQQALDRLFFELSETNETKLANYYDELIQRYDNDIKYKALLAKARLLLSQKEYDKVLELKNQFSKDTNSTEGIKVLEDAAFWAASSAISEDKCLEAVNVIEAYQGVAQRIKNTKKLFECYMRLSRFKQAEKLAKKHINTPDLPQKLSWMINLEHALFSQKKWKKTIALAKDIQSLGEVIEDTKANLALYDRFFSLMHLREYEKALQIASLIEEKMPQNFKNVEVYDKIVKMAKDEGNDIVLISYAKKAIQLQKKHQVFIMSPSLEYEYIASLQRVGKNEKAKDEALLLLGRDLNKNDRGRVLYTIAEAYVKTGEKNEAKKYFNRCVEFDERGSWSKICKENLNLLDTNSTN